MKIQVRLAKISDFSKFKKYYANMNYNWMYMSNKTDQLLPNKYESIDLNLEIERLQKERKWGNGILVRYIKEYMQYTEEDFANDLAKRLYKLFMIEKDGEVCGIFKVRCEAPNIRINSWACDLELQKEETLILMLELLTEKLKKTQRKETIRYSVHTMATYGISILEEIGFSKEGVFYFAVLE